MNRILIVEDDEARCAWFRARLEGSELDVTCDVRQAVAWLAERDYRAVLLDHDLSEEHYFSSEPDDERTGYAVARWLAENPTAQRDALIVVHSLNYTGARRMVEVLRDAGRDADHIPFHYLQTGLRL
ncbi:MAG TPA: cyclic-phosphate processing receiver domain-containing protein [Pyrinomonadaceae bacterium]